MFCAPKVISGGTEGVDSRFHVLRARTHFRRYRRCLVPSTCFLLPDMFLAVRRLLGPVFMFCALGQFFGENKGVGCHFHVLRSRSRFQRYRGRRVPFSSFALPDSFSEVPRALGPVFMFFAPGLVFGAIECVRPVFLFCALVLIFGTAGIGFRFQVFRS
jgi:hypothetical protein